MPQLACMLSVLSNRNNPSLLRVNAVQQMHYSGRTWLLLSKLLPFRYQNRYAERLQNRNLLH
jgi:hypothetical protein